jgi:5'(3')-deoxyribonucleotidase
VISRRPVFAVDIDGVACAHAEAICAFVRKEHGVRHTAEDITTWDHDFGPITFVEAVDKAYRNREFILGMKVTKGFRSFLSIISSRMDVVIVTTRKPYCRKDTRDWLLENLGDVTIRFVESKHEINASYLLDDNTDEVLRFLKKGRVAFLLRQPWNDNAATRKKLSRRRNCHFVDSFIDVLGILDQLQQGCRHV